MKTVVFVCLLIFTLTYCLEQEKTVISDKPTKTDEVMSLSTSRQSRFLNAIGGLVTGVLEKVAPLVPDVVYDDKK
ncbi:unnamed protein product [Orchesella dallaii]|uniref:Uncharacterized protein n=1 Tax=Orchesella dallaii TaxID=48710 RepID=A0ABP1RJ61_9HEXA